MKNRKAHTLDSYGSIMYRFPDLALLTELQKSVSEIV